MNSANRKHKKNFKCDLCKCDTAFSTYAKHLFSRVDDILRAVATSDDNLIDSNDADDFENNEMNERSKAIDSVSIERRLHHSISEFENFFKLLVSFCRHDEYLSEEIKIGKKFIEIFSLLKDEFRICRQYWVAVSNQINALDELDMARMRLRMRDSSDSNVKPHRAVHIIEPYEIQAKYREFNVLKQNAEHELRVKLGQLIYQHNLIKVKLILIVIHF